MLLLLSPAQVYVLADTTYNPLGVDEVAAEHMAAQCVVSTHLPSLPRAGTQCAPLHLLHLLGPMPLV